MKKTRKKRIKQPKTVVYRLFGDIIMIAIFGNMKTNKNPHKQYIERRKKTNGERERAQRKKNHHKKYTFLMFKFFVFTLNDTNTTFTLLHIAHHHHHRIHQKKKQEKKPSRKKIRSETLPFFICSRSKQTIQKYK